MKKTILEARSFASQGGVAQKRIVKNYEIDIECGDGRIYTYNDKTYKLKRGDVLVRAPGSEVAAFGLQKSYLLTLDFSSCKNDVMYSRNVPGEIAPLTDNELICELPDVLHPRNPYMLFELYEKLIQTPSLSSSAAHSLVDEIIFILNAEVAHKKYMHEKNGNDVMEKVINYMGQNLSNRITLDELAEVANFEKSYFIRFFKKESGMPPFKMLKEMRLARASDLIVSTEMKICDVASSLGYNTTSFFISEYKKRFGVTPSSHRQGIWKNGFYK